MQEGTLGLKSCAIAKTIQFKIFKKCKDKSVKCRSDKVDLFIYFYQRLKLKANI